MIIVVLLSIMFGCLFLGFPMFIGMLTAAIVVTLVYFQNMSPELLMQQLMVGISTYVLLAIPMFILAAEIMCAGEAANRLLGLLRAFVGHIRGGLAITCTGACTIFGAISGSTQATLVAIGKPMEKELEKAGYKTEHAIALLMCSANIALLIPPSICMIMYAVITGTSVAELFIAGLGPGLFVFVLFSIYEFLIAKHKGIILQKKATWEEKVKAVKSAILPLGFPIIVLGGIYTGMFSPTEASAVSVLYALILEVFIFKSLKLKDMPKIALSTGTVTATVFILVAAGQAFSWIVSFAGIPQMMASGLIGPETSKYAVFAIISISLFVACMFVDSIPVILILTPIFYPIAIQVGIDPVHLGILVTLQAAIGAITPPFGCNIFTASAIFDKPFFTVVKGLTPYIAMFIFTTIVLIYFPQLALFLKDLAFPPTM